MKVKYAFALAVLAGISGLCVLRDDSMADGADCQNVTTYAEIDACLRNADDILLKSDIQLPRLSSTLRYNRPGESTVLDLGGHTLAGATEGYSAAVLEVRAGELTIKNGTIGGKNLPGHPLVIHSVAEVDDTSYTVVNVEKDVKLLSEMGYGIKIEDEAKHAYATVLNMDGEIDAYTGIYVEEDVMNHENYPSIHIGSTAKITASGAHAIVAGGYAGWNIEAAQLTGKSGMGVKSGRFYIDGAEIRATGEDTYPRPMAADMRNTGAALQIEVIAGETDESEMYVKSGKFVSEKGYAINEYPQNVNSESVSLGKFRVYEGEFVGTNDFDNSVVATMTGAFVWYYGDGQMLEDGSMFLETMDAYDSHKMTIERYAESVTGFQEMLADPGYDYIERIVPVYTPYDRLDEYDEAALEEAGYNPSSVVSIYDITPRAFFYDMGTPEPGMSKIYSIVTGTGNYPITFTMKIPDMPAVADGYKRTYFVLNLHMNPMTGEYEILRLPVTVSEDGEMYSFATNRFSTFALVYEDVYVPNVPNTGIVQK